MCCKGMLKLPAQAELVGLNEGFPSLPGVHFKNVLMRLMAAFVLFYYDNLQLS